MIHEEGPGLREERAALERSVLLRQAAECLAHEIRNPLGMVRATLQLVRRRIDAEDARARLDEAIGLLDGVVEAGAGLFGFETNVCLNCETLDLAELARELASGYQRRFDRRGVQFRLACPGRPLAVRADRQMLLLALECLVEGFLLLTPAGQNEPLEVACLAGVEDQPDCVAFEIVGAHFLPMPEDLRWRCYDPLLFDHGFAEAWPFSVAHYLVARHGGHIRFQRTPDCRVRLRNVLPAGTGGQATGARGGAGDE